MNKLRVGLLVLCSGFLFNCGPLMPESRSFQPMDGIFGGRVAAGGDAFTFHTVLITDESTRSRCSGTLIAEDMVLTAAHCLRAGSDSVTLQFFMPSNSGSRFFKIKAHSFSRHDRYHDEKFLPVDAGDLALIHFRAQLPSEFKAALMDHDFSRFAHRKEVFTAAGFGVSNRLFGSGSGVLRFVNVPLFEVRGKTEFATTQFKEGVCFGDSGGPLFKSHDGRYILVGVASRASKVILDCVGLAVYTRVDAYQDWITEASERLRRR